MIITATYTGSPQFVTLHWFDIYSQPSQSFSYWRKSTNFRGKPYGFYLWLVINLVSLTRFSNCSISGLNMTTGGYYTRRWSISQLSFSCDQNVALFIPMEKNFHIFNLCCFDAVTIKIDCPDELLHLFEQAPIRNIYKTSSLFLLSMWYSFLNRQNLWKLLWDAVTYP